ncbi:leucine-rich repeat-containing protein 61-like [Liolophura sinensis]|uniref:leucine-rich repeat-containing protein 61-like n=1 Tax=Liolophura sinensis TaxID=3198878 RepID=UPI003158F157
MSLSSDRRVTRMMLKARSGEFDVESIHSLSLRDMGLSELGCIGECSSLERLDLSGNELCQLYALASLVNLSSLNLTSNRISSLEGLQALDSLQILNVSGNNIRSVDGLRYVSGLEKLRELRLKDSLKGLTNPICSQPLYKSEVKAMFPDLLSLDGERLHGKGSELFQMCDEIDQAIKANAQSKDSGAVPVATDWTPEGFWEPRSTQFDQSSLHDAEQQLEILLKSCKHLSEQAALSIQHATS